MTATVGDRIYLQYGTSERLWLSSNPLTGKVAWVS